MADLEPFQGSERIINLVSTKHGEKGQLRLRLMFQPEIIAKARKNTSTFSTAGRAMTQFGALPVSAGKGVLHGVTGVFRGKQKEEIEVNTPPVPSAPAGQASHPVGQPESLGQQAAAFPSRPPTDNGHAGHNEPGTLRVSVLDAKDLVSNDYKPYAVIRLGDKEYKTKHTGKTATPEWYVYCSRSLRLLFNPNVQE